MTVVKVMSKRTPKQLRMEDQLEFSEARDGDGEFRGCRESCCSVCCCCCCRPAYAEDHHVAECSGVCCYKWCALFPHVGCTCCTIACERCYLGCPCCCPCRMCCCKPYMPFDEWTCPVHMFIAGLRSLIDHAPMENIYATQMLLTDVPMPFCLWPCGVKCRKVRAWVDKVECTDGEMKRKRVVAEWMEPSGFEPNGKVVLYFHGGAFVFFSAGAERFHTGLLAKYLRCRVLSCDYPRPPKHPYPEPVDSAYAAWQWLTAEGEGKGGVNPSDVIISGDSAGGNLAISLTRRLKSMGQKPGGLLLFSPWVEMIPFPSHSWECNKDYDFIAFKHVLHQMVDLYTNQEDPKSVSVSPVRADVEEFEDWPPVFISVGGAEVLRTSLENFGAKLEQADVKTKVYKGRGMPHVFQLLAMAVPAPKANLLPCFLRCCGGGWCCTRSPSEGQPEHPVWESMREARSFLNELA